MAAQAPYAQADFLRLLERGSGEVIARANELETLLLASLRILAEIRQRLAGLAGRVWPDTRADIDQQLRRLLAPCFMRDTLQDWLAQMPRYLKAVRTRVERLPGNMRKTRRTPRSCSRWPLLRRAAASHPGLWAWSDEAAHYRWLLEEFRSPVCPESRTRQAVSAKRLQEQWQAVAQWLEQPSLKTRVMGGAIPRDSGMKLPVWYRVIT